MSTLVTFLLDRTGSMWPVRDDTIGAFNTYLETLQADPKGILFTLLQFDSTSVDTLYKAAPVDQVAKLTPETYEPRDMTPLIDAAVKTIQAVAEQVAAMIEAPKVVICIQTDGHENASKMYTWEHLAKLVKEKTALGWQFNFMGASIDAYDQGGQMGITSANTISYNKASKAATASAFYAAAQNTAGYARGMSASTAFSAHQKAASEDAYDPAPPADPPPPGAGSSLVDEIDLKP
jgi:hypothetical protein